MFVVSGITLSTKSTVSKKGHKMAKKRHHDSMYNERRHSEMMDAGMIREDKSAVTNMPQGVMYKPWGGKYDELDHGQDDTIRGIDMQRNEDHAVAKRHNNPSKW